MNADGTETVRYKIREEAVWADGTPISGDDFLFTYETIIDPGLPIDKTIYEDILPASVAAGPKTLEYTLAQPTVQAELIFGVLIPKHDVEGSDFVNDWNDQMWVAGGPFVFDQWEPGEFVRLVRNDAYWRTDPDTGQLLPYLDSLVFRFLAEDELLDAFVAREIDVVNPAPSVEAIEILQAQAPLGAVVEVLQGPIWEHLNFQFGENRLSRNPDSYNEFFEYRKAVAHAIDKQKIVDEILDGQVDPLDSYVDAFDPALSQNAWAQYDHDPATAQQFVADLCARPDTDCAASPVKAIFSTTSNNDARVLLAELLEPMFADAGIAYEAQLEHSGLFFGETLDAGNWDIGEWAWVGTPGLAGIVGIHDVFDPEAPPPFGSNFYRWGTPGVPEEDIADLLDACCPDLPPEVRAAIIAAFAQGPSSVVDQATARFAEVRDEMNATVDAEELRVLINEAESILADNVVMIPLYARLDPGAVWADEVGGYKHNPSQASDTWNVGQWFRADLEIAGLLGALGDAVEALGLPGGTGKGLLAKLDNALRHLADANPANDVAARNSLEAFINQVRAQSGKKIDAADAHALIAAAEEALGTLTP